MRWQQYAAAWAGHYGGYDLRRGTVPVRVWFGLGYLIARGLAALRVPAAVVGWLGLLPAVAVPLTAGTDPTGLWAAAGLTLLAAFTVVLDRTLVVIQGLPTPRAAIRATVISRLGELAGLVGFWVAGVPGPLVVVCGLMSWLYELIRQEAVAAGMSQLSALTLAERPARLSVLVTGFGLAGVVGLAEPGAIGGLLAMALVGWLLFAVFGLGQLVGAVRKALR
jgi:hypothetical protein